MKSRTTCTGSNTKLEVQDTHTLLWIKDAPVIGKNSAEEVKAYIESICTCAKPDPETSPSLHQLVTKFQTHHCNKYCTKVYKQNNKFYKKCRFGFPRPSKTGLELNDVTDCLAVNTKKQPRKRLYYLARKTDESAINGYNRALLLANQANADVQYIANDFIFCPMLLYMHWTDNIMVYCFLGC